MPSLSVTTVATVASTCAWLVSEESRLTLTPMPSLYSVSAASAGASVASAGASVASAGSAVGSAAGVSAPHAVSVSSMHARRRTEMTFFIVFDLLFLNFLLVISDGKANYVD